MSLEDALRARGVPEDEIQDLLLEAGDQDDDEPRKPRTVSEWKRAARAAEEKAQKLERENASYRLRDEFEQVRTELPDDVRALVTWEDVRNEPKLTPSLLRVKAQEKQEAQEAAIRVQAKQLGFEDPEQFKQALALAAQQAQAQAGAQQQNLNNLAAATNLTMQGAPPAPFIQTRQQVDQMVGENATPFEIAEAMSKNLNAFIPQNDQQ